MFYCYEYLLRIAPSVMVPQLSEAFNASSVLVGEISAFYFYAYTPMQIVVGVILDKHGPRRILTLAVLACAVGTAVFGMADTFFMACVGRFLIGFGSAFAFVGVLKLATIWLPPDRFAMVSGLTTTLGMIGAIFGQNILVRMVHTIGWADTIIYSGYFGFLLFPVVWFIVRDVNPRNQHKGQSSSISYAQVFRDVKKVVTNRQIWINGLVGGLIMLPTTVFAELWGVPFLEVQKGFSPSKCAFAVSLIFAGWAVGSPVAGLLSDVLKRRKLPLMIGSLLAFFIMGAILYLPDLSDIALYCLLFGFGVVSSVEVICFAIGRENAPFAVAATAVAFTNLIVVVAGLFQPLVGKILDMKWAGLMQGTLRVYQLEDYHTALLILPISIALSFVLSFFIKETYCRPVDMN
ncbi:MAG: MFS transporter [Gammaproteobacteria bacterium]